MAAEVVGTVSKETVSQFLERHMEKGQTIKSDAFPALNVISKNHDHQKKVTPPEEAGKWLPKVHIIIGNIPITRLKAEPDGVLNLQNFSTDRQVFLIRE